MDERFTRTSMLFGEQAVNKLNNSHIAIFGIGGVGGYVVEALARSGIGTLDLIDKDTVSISNINRQIIALTSSIGRPKAELAAERAKDINPNIKVNVFNVFYTAETSKKFDFKNYDYIVDAIDTVSGKIELIMQAKTAGVPIISSMGTGNKLDPSQLEIADIYKTSVCPLARVMRKELKSRGIKKLTVVYSKEQPVCPSSREEDPVSHKIIPASYACVPSAAGLIIASKVIRDISFANIQKNI